MTQVHALTLPEAGAGSGPTRGVEAVGVSAVRPRRPLRSWARGPACALPPATPQVHGRSWSPVQDRPPPPPRDPHPLRVQAPGHAGGRAGRLWLRPSEEGHAGRGRRHGERCRRGAYAFPGGPGYIIYGRSCPFSHFTTSRCPKRENCKAFPGRGHSSWFLRRKYRSLSPEEKPFSRIRTADPRLPFRPWRWPWPGG